jgi:anti-sigma factor RsiW
MTANHPNDCARWRDKLPAFADGALDAADHAAVAAHIAGCTDCRDASEREELFTGWLVSTLRQAEPAPAGLRDRVRSGPSSAVPAPASPWWAQWLGSAWAPRLAMAAGLALLFLVPVVRRLWVPPAQATVATRQHVAHDRPPGAPLLPCCTALDVHAVGDRLGPPSEGCRVPDLRAAGLEWIGATRCTFAPAPVNMIVYRAPSGARFSLDLSRDSNSQFKQLRLETRDGVAQAQYDVRVGAPPTAYTVTLWRVAGVIMTWVGPKNDPAYAPALHVLQTAGSNPS